MAWRSSLPVGSRRTRTVAVCGGLAYGSPNLLAGLFTAQVGPWLVYAAVGAALVGATLAVSLDAYRLVGPTAVVAVLFGFALYRLWRLLESPVVAMVGDPFQLYLGGWPAVLALAAGAGALERYARSAVADEEPRGSAE